MKRWRSKSLPAIDPLGKRIVSEYDQEHPIEIIGVIDDIKEGPLGHAADCRGL